MASMDLTTRDCVGYVTRDCVDYVVVALRGELDMAGAAEAAAAFAVVVGEPEIIVDMVGLEFVGSSGLAALTRGRKLARLVAGDLRLAAGSPRCSGCTPSPA